MIEVEGNVYKYNPRSKKLDVAIPEDTGKIVWQKYLFPALKKAANDLDINDTNEVVHAVRDWLNNH